MVFYGAIAMTLIAAFMAYKAWGTVASLAFAVINALVILFFPLGNILGLGAACAVLYFVSRPAADEAAPDDEPPEPPEPPDAN